jgi:hypothetical protein
MYDKVFYVTCEYFIRQIKHRRIRWVRHVARMGKERKMYEVLLENLKERDHSEEDKGADWRTESEWILRRLAEGGGVYSTGSG